MKIHWKPTKKQEEALRRNDFEILFGGARGGGKTDCGQAWMLYEIANPLYRGLVIRRNATDLSDWVERAKIMYRPTGATFTGAVPKITFPSGAIIYTGHLKDESSFEKYQGHEYHRMLIEELTQIPTESRYLKLISSCRSTVEGLPAQIFATTNPGGDGHSWVKQRFIDVSQEGESYLDPITKRSRVFIRSLVDDNPYIMKNDPDYVNFLEGLPEDIRAAWRYGSWDHYKVEGAIYENELTKLEKEGRIMPLKLDKSLPCYTAWDLGMSDYTAVGIFQMRGNLIYLVDYIQESYKPIEFYVNWLKDKGVSYESHYLPHDVSKSELGTGKSVLEVLQGLNFQNIQVCKRISIQEGILATRMIFDRLHIADHLIDFIDCIRNYKREWDERLNKFKDKPLHNWASHGADMLRYYAIMDRLADYNMRNRSTHSYDYSKVSHDISTY